MRQLEQVDLSKVKLPYNKKTICFFQFCKSSVYGYAGFCNALNKCNPNVILDRPTADAAFCHLALQFATEVQPTTYSKRFGVGKERRGIWDMLLVLWEDVFRNKKQKYQKYWNSREKLSPGLAIDDYIRPPSPQLSPSQLPPSQSLLGRPQYMLVPRMTFVKWKRAQEIKLANLRRLAGEDEQIGGVLEDEESAWKYDERFVEWQKEQDIKVARFMRGEKGEEQAGVEVEDEELALQFRDMKVIQGPDLAEEFEEMMVIDDEL